MKNNQFKFNLNKFKETASSLGIEVKLDSATPGIFFVSNDKKTKVNMSEALPQIFMDSKEKSFTIPGLKAYHHGDVGIEMDINKYFNVKGINENAGAA